MENAFQRCFADGFTAVVLIGSDIPDLPPEILAEAFAALDSRGAVIGPAVDGGYYLIGFTKEMFAPGVFEGISWSTEAVFRRNHGPSGAGRGRRSPASPLAGHGHAG